MLCFSKKDKVTSLFKINYFKEFCSMNFLIKKSIFFSTCLIVIAQNRILHIVRIRINFCYIIQLKGFGLFFYFFGSRCIASLDRMKQKTYSVYIKIFRKNLFLSYFQKCLQLKKYSRWKINIQSIFGQHKILYQKIKKNLIFEIL